MNIHKYMKETAKEVDKYTLEFLDELKKKNKDLPVRNTSVVYILN